MSLNKLLSYDGIIYRWRGSLKELKSFVEQYLKMYGSWTSPGGDTKVFRAEQSDFAIKWYGVTSEKNVIQADNEDRYLELLFRNMVSSHENNGSESPAEVITLDESRPVGELASLRSARRPARRRGVSFSLKTNAEYFDSIEYV